jgi:hypothetical protein
MKVSNSGKEGSTPVGQLLLSKRAAKRPQEDGEGISASSHDVGVAKTQSKTDARLQKAESRYERFQSRLLRKQKDEESPPPEAPSPPVSTAPPVSTTPPSNQSGNPVENTIPVPKASPVTQSDSASRITELAKKYVQVYEKNSGVSLSSEERDALVRDVSKFYSEPIRGDRLERLVSAF